MISSRGDALRLSDILRSIGRIEEVLEEGFEPFSKSWLSQSAVVRELEVIGEAAGAVSLTLRKRHPEVAWSQMRGFSSFSKHEDLAGRPAETLERRRGDAFAPRANRESHT